MADFGVATWNRGSTSAGRLGGDSNDPPVLNATSMASSGIECVRTRFHGLEIVSSFFLPLYSLNLLSQQQSIYMPELL